MNSQIKILKEINLERIGHFLLKNKFIVEYNHKYLELEMMTYIHTMDREIIRIGSGKNKVIFT